MHYPAMLIIALCGIGGCGPELYDSAPKAGDPGHEMTQEPDLIAKLDQIEKGSGGRPVRVIVTVEPNEKDRIAAIETVTGVMLEYGAYSVDPIDGTSLLVAEAHLGALRAAADTGLVADVVLDELSAPSQ